MLKLVKYYEDMDEEQKAQFRSMNFREKEAYVNKVIEKFTADEKAEIDKILNEGITSQNIRRLNFLTEELDRKINTIWYSFF